MMPINSRLFTFIHAGILKKAVNHSRLFTPPFKGREWRERRESGFGECSEVETLAMQWLLKLREATP